MATARKIFVLFLSLTVFFVGTHLAAAALDSDFTQCSNENPTPGECKWINGILNPSNSDYNEGMSVPQRLIITDIPATAGDDHTLIFTHAWSKGGIHAYDFLTAWNQGNTPPITLNPCANTGGLASTCTALRSGFSATADVPDDPFVSKDGPTQTIINNYESIEGDRRITIYANAPVTDVILTMSHSGPDTGDSEAHYTLNWTSNATQVMVEWGGHLAVSGMSSVAWGPGLGAGSITGGPYHFTLATLDGASLGAQSNQIMAGAVQGVPTGNLTVIKHVINDDDGRLAASDFSLHLNSTGNQTSFQGSETGTTFIIELGAYSVTEDTVVGYTASYSANCTGTIADGEARTCIVTNDDDTPPNATLRVIKAVTNDNGGTLGVADFTLYVDSTTVLSNATTSLTAGTYAVSETGMPGYVGTIGGDCAANGSVVLAPGDAKVCTIANDDLPAKLIVVKEVTNSYGGTLGPSAFTIRVNGTDASLASFAGNASGTLVTLDAGAFSVSEEAVAGYTPNYSADCAGTIGINETKTCTITNADMQSSITVTKVVINDDGGLLGIEDFTLRVGTTNVTSGQVFALNAGTYTVSEDAVAGYSGNITGDCAADGSVTIGLGEHKACTITNDDQPAQLTVIKTIINDNGGTLDLRGVTLRIDGNTVVNGTANQVQAGMHTVSEDAILGYTTTIGGDCDATGAVTLLPGDSKTCYVTNNDEQAHLTVVKYVVNEFGGTLDPGSFTLYVNGTAVTNNVTTAFDAGAYVVSEDAVAGYTGIISGDCDANGNVILQVGESKTCYITNTDTQGSLTVTKRVTNDNGGTLEADDFTLYIDAIPVTSGQTLPVSAGTYVVSEGSMAGYVGTIGGDCDANGTVTIAVGQHKACTIVNDDQPATLTVIKHITNDNGGALTLADFTLRIGTDTVTNGTPNTLDAGTYVVSESGPAGYTGVFTGDCDANGSVTLLPGESKTCTITNDDEIAQITVIKAVVNDNGGTKTETDFPLFIGATSVMSGVPQNVDAGTYSVSETAAAGYSASFSGDCDSNGTVTVAPGQSKTCTITNDDIAPTLRVVKTVNNTNGGALEPGSFTLYVNGNVVVNNAVNTFDAGAYVVSEDTIEGYTGIISGDCDANGNVILQVGESKTCYITNSDLAASLTVTKFVINDNGGTKAISDFPLFIGATSVTSGQAVALPAGTYVVSETGSTGYGATIAGDCAANGSVTLGVGQHKSCTITNDDMPAYLTVVKVVNNNQGDAVPGDFALYVNSTPVTSGTATQLNAGAYRVTEDSIPHYEGSFSGDCDEDGDVVLQPGDSKTCILTNQELLRMTCEEAKEAGLLHAQIDGGTAVVHNDANQSFIVSLAAYQMYALTIFDQTLFSSDTDLVPANGNVTLDVDLPLCAYQIEVVCGEPEEPPLYDENETIAFHFGHQEDFCVKDPSGDVDLSIAPWFPQGRSYVFVCEPQNFTALSYDWHFGDGELQLGSTNEDVFHTYSADGNYTVTCTAYGEGQTGTGVLPIGVGGTIVPPDDNTTDNETGCFSTALTMPVTCIGGSVTQDTNDGSCRTVVCANGGSSMQAMACDKPDEGAKIYFELYKQSAVGDLVSKICIGSTCVGDYGFAMSTSYPICEGTVTPPVDPLVTPSIGLSIAPWYPQGNDYVFICDAPGATSYDWHFGDGEKLLGVANSDVFHTFAAPGSYDVSCAAAGMQDVLHVEVAGIVD